ncbi:hypothetical protein EHS25_000747 [Saitozyma podzolica]|uniref:Endoplasmic reticulum junction formation protein lunapark n=1 Tax=Saitozyma podzolica TaxID=1890683 RepID=A0A427YX49_9TREE|nr:hypothetical protein EHS25_000747 [Saitozyma podzolica]
MGLFSWFSKSSKPDYETVLAQLATDINDAKIHLSEIRLRERRFTLLVNAYGIALWAVWVGLWWVRGLPLGLVGLSFNDVEGRLLGAGGVLVGPVFIWALNRLLHFIFTRIRSSEESHLRLLLTKQRKQVEDIKKATNYDSTRKLIERYDEMGPGPGPGPQPGMSPGGGGPSTPQRGQPQPQTPTRQAKGGTPRAPGHLAGAGGTPVPGQTPGTPIPIPEGLTAEQAAALQMQMHAIQPVLPTPEKKWYDRVVDSILGDDPSQASQSKYALVCGECFRHNGLVGSKYEWERMQWICPRCNHLNPPPISRLSKSELQSSTAPAPGPTTSSSQPLPSSPITPSAHLRSSASPRPRRHVGERGTPRSSRLGQEVFSASSEDDTEEDQGDKMDVDDEK